MRFFIILLLLFLIGCVATNHNPTGNNHLWIGMPKKDAEKACNILICRKSVYRIGVAGRIEIENCNGCGYWWRFEDGTLYSYSE